MLDENIDNAETKTTHFGFEDVAWSEKANRVNQVFSSVASNYDLMNDLMSLGVHHLWKRVAVSQMLLKKNLKVLDLAGGTGDITQLVVNRQPSSEVVIADLNAEMLREGRAKLLDKGIFQGVEYAQVDAEKLPFSSNSFDRIIISFGLRNVRDKQAALQSMYRVLKPGGRLVILEFSKVVLPLLSKLYDAYSFNILPKLGALIANDADSYQYLAESIRKHPDQETLQGMMRDAGFDQCEYQNLSAGIVAIHVGVKY